MRAILALALALAAAMLLGGCATGIVARSDHDPSQAFLRYDSFAWLADEPMLNASSDVQVSPINRQRIVDAVEAELTSKGIRKVGSRDQARFLVAYTVGARDRIDVDAVPNLSHHPWSWGEMYFGDEVDVTTYREGKLAIDVFDGESKRPVWHGWISRRISEQDVQRAGELIPAAVRAILASFPPNAASDK